MDPIGKFKRTWAQIGTTGIAFTAKSGLLGSEC